MSMEEFTVRESCEKETSNLNAGVALQSIESVIEESARSIQGIPRTDVGNIARCNSDLSYYFNRKNMLS